MDATDAMVTVLDATNVVVIAVEDVTNVVAVDEANMVVPNH